MTDRVRKTQRRVSRFASGHEPQHELFQLLCDVYNLARLTENGELLDLAIWLQQADNFHQLLKPGCQFGPVAISQALWRPGPTEMLREQRQLYLNALKAFEPYLPARLLRQARHMPPARTARRKETPL